MDNDDFRKLRIWEAVAVAIILGVVAGMIISSLPY